jgi:transcription elongation factor GreA
MAQTYLSREGLKKLQEEHKHLQQQKWELTEEVSKAAAHGDLRENAEYHAARERLQHVSSRLADLDGKLNNVLIIDDLNINPDEARVGSLIQLRDEQTREKVDYQLVGPDEADPKVGKISIASPLGKAVLGKKVGDSFNLMLPRAIVPYKVLSVSRPE